MEVRVGVTKGLEWEEEEEEEEEVVVVVAGRRDEGLGLGSVLENAARGVKFVFAGMIDALCGVEEAVGVDDSSWRRRDGVDVAGVALADAPKKLLKRSLGELSRTCRLASSLTALLCSSSSRERLRVAEIMPTLPAHELLVWEI